MITAAAVQIHATCVAFDEGAVLLRGPSGAGKSDLALRLIDRGARLVADDRVDIERADDALIARAPRALAGLLEIRGIGIETVPALAQAEIALVVDLVPRAEVERMPEPQTVAVLGRAVPRIALDAFEASTPLKIVFALRHRAPRAAAKPAA